MLSDWEHFAFGVDMGDVCFEDGTGGYSKGFVLDDLEVVDGGLAGPREPNWGGVGDDGFYQSIVR